jgi:hypothetical protein
MTASTPIARLVESMLADGVEHAAIVRAVEVSEKNLHRRLTVQSGSRGTRLPADWTPPENCAAYAASLGMPPNQIMLEAEKFRNYWTAKSGAGATKRDWAATWRNWILNTMERHHDAARHRHGRSSRADPAARRPPTGADAVLAGMGRLAHRLDQNRTSPRHNDRTVEAYTDVAGAPRSEGKRT